MKVRKKPVVVDAQKFTRFGDLPELVKTCYSSIVIGERHDVCGGCGADYDDHGLIDTLEGSSHIVCPGDWIITGVKGEHYPIKNDIFMETYEPAG